MAKISPFLLEEIKKQARKELARKAGIANRDSHDAAYFKALSTKMLEARWGSKEDKI